MWNARTVPLLLTTLGVAAVAAMPLLAAASSTARAQQREGFDGRSVFRTYCVVCHGESARGGGPLASSLKVPPPDLTQFARQNNGTFPRDMVTRIVDGREPVKGHGGGDMPVWGDAFSQSMESSDPESVKRKIAAVVDYLETIQAR